MDNQQKRYHVDLEFQPIKLPLVRDVLVVCKKFSRGKEDIMEAFKFIAPDEFELFDIPSEISSTVEAIVVNKRILKKIHLNGLISILESQVFPYLSHGEAVKVDLDLRIATSLSINLED